METQKWDSQVQGNTGINKLILGGGWLGVCVCMHECTRVCPHVCTHYRVQVEFRGQLSGLGSLLPLLSGLL